MSARTFNLVQVSDSKAIEGIIEICTTLNLQSKARFSFSLGADTQALTLPNIDQIKSNKTIQEIMSSDKTIIERIAINIEENPRTIKNLAFVRKPPYDIFEVSFDNCPFELSLKVLDAIQSAFVMYDSTQDLDKKLGPELADFYRKREQGLVRLESLSQKLIEKNEEYRRTVDSELHKEKNKLKEEYGNLNTKLHSEIEHQQEALDAREKELDDRKNTHARRQLRSDIKQELKNRSEKFNLTKSTTRKRWPIHSLFIFLIGSILTLLFITLHGNITPKDNSSSYLELYSYIRLAILGISLVVTVIFYIHWNDRWAQIHAEEEFRLKRLDLDIDRASWIVEMAMEWQAENKTELPKELLDKLSCNLFSSKESMDITKHPYEELVKMLFSVSAEAKIPIPGGGEIRIDKQGMKNLAKS